MPRILLPSTVCLLIAAIGCGGQPSNGDTEMPPTADSLAETQSPPAQPSADSAADPGSAAAAVAVVGDYYAAIDGGDYARAYAFWLGEGDASGQTLEEFRGGYADTRSVRVEVGAPGRIEPAAGSRYVEVPVAVHAESTSGATRCFQGPYVLRRAVVPGATEEQRVWRIHSADLREVDSAACEGAARWPATDSAAAVVSAFGEQLASVSLLAPPDALRRDLRARYAPLVTSALLEAWLADPATAPGREVSSPWPDRIEIGELTALATDRYRASGTIVYVTSTEAGSDAAADRRPVVLEIVRSADRTWRITRVTME